MRFLTILTALLLMLVCVAPAKPSAAGAAKPGTRAISALRLQSRGGRSAPRHSRFTPDPVAAHKWTYHYFGHTPAARQMLCIAYTESRYELAATNGANLGPTQINVVAHPWVNGWRLTHSWRYAMAVSWRISGHGTNFGPWTPDCGA